MRGLRINKRTGHLAEYESDTEQRGDQYLALRGFLAIKTQASDVGRGKRGSIAKYHSDRVYVRSDEHPAPHVLFIEWKGPNAHTAPNRRLGQVQFINEMRRLGFTTFICPDGHPNPFGAFEAWVKSEGIDGWRNP